MEQDIENRSYELAYHLNSDIEETEVRKYVQELEDLVAQNGGSVLISREPKHKHLSYPLKHKHYSYFGCLDFSAFPENIEKINAAMKLQSNVIRYLLTEKLFDEKELRVLGMERPRTRIKTHEPAAVETGKPKVEETQPGQIEKEIEEVLEKL